MAQDPPVDRAPIVFRPETFDRHQGAVEYVEGLIRTRAPLPGTGRFPGLVPGAWGLLAIGDTIGAGSGLSLGHGTVTLCTRDGATLTDTGEVVTVYNSGAAIPVSGSARVVAMEWTGAGWSVCECLAAPSLPCGSPCLPCDIPKADLAATWTKGTGAAAPATGGGTMTYYPGGIPGDTSGFFGGPSWQYFPPNPTAGGQKAAWVRATCFDGVFLVALEALISSTSSLACPSVNPCWIVNHSLFGPTFDCLVVTSEACSPFAFSYRVSEAGSGCAGALGWFHDLTITGPEVFYDAALVCCDQCPIPRANLTLTIGASTTTLVFASEGPDWSDGTHTLSCGSGIVTLGGGGTWTKVGAATTCSPYHVEFRDGATTAFVDE